MKAHLLYPSELKSWQEQLEKSCLIWPFFASHSLARQAMAGSAAEQEAYLISLKGRPVLFIQIEEMEKEVCVVKNVLAVELWSQKKMLQLIQQFARGRFRKRLVFDFSGAPFSIQQEIFLENGFQRDGEDFTKELPCKIGLVLGGGGSHGAYQVGVWQALIEEDIPIQVVTGTSVGALNGALVAQGDFEEAKTLWQRMSTDEVMVFPKAAEKPEDLPSLMGQIASLTGHALMNRGVSTEPLRKILAERMSYEKMDSSDIAFFFVATRIRGMKEIVASYTPDFKKDWLSWLMASASFYPAMQAQKIGEDYYIDGGYRNNIPIDAALAQGVTECITVDVQGPGIVKGTKVPENVNLIPVHSPWSLGSFLLFSPKRSRENMALGYLETLKALGKLQGRWYSFHLEEDLEKDWEIFCQDFGRKINEKNFAIPRQFLKKIRKLYRDRVAFENCGQVFLELAGKYAMIEPSEIYTCTGLKEKIGQALAEDRAKVQNDLSVAEWLDKYYQENALLSDTRQVKRVYQLLLGIEGSAEEAAELYDKAPLQTIFGAYLLYIKG